MKKSFFKCRNPRKGISMMELVISLVVITIVSAAAVSIIVSSSTHEAETVNRMYAQKALENTSECFYFAESYEDLGDLLVSIGYEKGQNTPYYIYTVGEYTLTVTFPEDTSEPLKTLEIRTQFPDEEEKTYTYTRG